MCLRGLWFPWSIRTFTFIRKTGMELELPSCHYSSTVLQTFQLCRNCFQRVHYFPLFFFLCICIYPFGTLFFLNHLLSWPPYYSVPQSLFQGVSHSPSWFCLPILFFGSLSSRKSQYEELLTDTLWLQVFPSQRSADQAEPWESISHSWVKIGQWVAKELSSGRTLSEPWFLQLWNYWVRPDFFNFLF